MISDQDSVYSRREPRLRAIWAPTLERDADVSMIGLLSIPKYLRQNVHESTEHSVHF